MVQLNRFVMGGLQDLCSGTAPKRCMYMRASLLLGALVVGLGLGSDGNR